MKIARDKLAKDGYLFPAPNNEVLEGIRLTGKGWVRNQEHLREGFDGASKDREFEKLFKMIEPRLYELDGPGGKKPPKQAQAGNERAGDERAKVRDDAGPTPALYPPPKK
jgi:hypothetical protein